MAVVLWIITGVVLMSFVEYAAHRWVMHLPTVSRSTFEEHARLHHGRFYQTFTGDTDPAAKHVGLSLWPPNMLVWMLPAWGTAAWFSPLGGGIWAAIFVAYGVLWNAFHWEMHEPKSPWWSRSRWFRRSREYHRIHHDHPRCNYAALFPGVWDWVFRSRPPSSPTR